ncbi:hypothetical protein SI65_07140 [Aspergillus cristatus]|uniref:Uncharacterized protein n=1 Tax=Aspergillus cristatus TaxID=573508 RepID=A0A1E3B924_ASPCR|nr:hypothetical protein SI65_07140 [Aspergillus cristatus]
MGMLTRPFNRISKRTTRHMSSWSSNHDLFEYTSGRFLFNEQRRLAERRVQFNVDALVDAVCRSTGQSASEIFSLSKLTENGYNRIIQTSFKDGHTVLAKIPYKIAVPRRLAVASEVATLDLLRRTGVPVPKVLAYCADRTNSVGAEYILFEKPEGRPLSETWLSMKNEMRAEVMKQIAAAESKFLDIPFPSNGCGSLYYCRDLGETQFSIPLPAQSGIIPPPDLIDCVDIL